MHFAFSDEDLAFRQELRDFYEQELPADWYGGYDERDAMHEFIRSVRKKMADRQWLTMAWPKEYGGQDAPITRQLIFAEESAYYRFNARDQGVGFLGPAIWMHGTEEQKQRFLGPISSADVAFHQGFSEPDAGSDLAGLRTQARRDGDDFVINGQKIWGGHLHLADYSFLLARTDPDAPKHKGISFFVIPADTPGIRYEEFGNLAGSIQNVVYYDNCRVNARECLIGEENQGWYIATTVLNHERTVVEHAPNAKRQIEDLVKVWRDFGWSTADPVRANVRHRLAQMAIEAEVCLMLAYRIGWLQSIGHQPSYEASQVKIFGSELTQRLAHNAAALLGLYAQIERHTAKRSYVLADGRVEHLIRMQLMYSIIGGANEIQRNVIAGRGLGLPRS